MRTLELGWVRRRTGGHSRSVVLCDLLTHDEDLLVPLHLLNHGLIEGLTYSHLLGSAGGGIGAQRRKGLLGAEGGADGGGPRCRQQAGGGAE